MSGTLQFSRKTAGRCLDRSAFALPTAVAGIALTSLYAPTGWIGQYLEPLGIQVAYTPYRDYTSTDFYWSAFCRAHGTTSFKRCRN